jgi:hypothetical protein
MASPAVRPSTVVLAALALAAPAALAQTPQRVWARQDDDRRDVTVRATPDGFVPARLDARFNEMLAVTLVAEGGPHAFAIDAYRIAKRVTPASPITFEFRADQAGRFTYYCTLTAADGRQHDERGELVVRR